MKLSILIAVALILVISMSYAQEDIVSLSLELENYYTTDQGEDYVCASTDSFTGILFFGRFLNSVSIEAEDRIKMKVSQDIGGNKFIIPVSYDGCEKISKRKNSLTDDPMSAFIPVEDKEVLLKLYYSDIEIFGYFVHNTPADLILEKNSFSEIEIRTT